jgi:hypothetical protein
MTDDTATVDKADLDYSRPSTLDKTTMARVLKTWFRDDASHSAKWRGEAKEDFDFRAGHGQWSADERAQLKEALRPDTVFNRALLMIKAVAGFEINGRHEIQFLPRTTQSSALNEVLTGASKWMADQCEAEDEESEAFQDCATCGMGWTENRMDFERDSSGLYEESQVSPLEMYWDYAARKNNLVDCRRMARLKKFEASNAKGMFPGFDVVQLDARWAVGMDPNEETKSIEDKRKRDDNASDNFIERDEVHIVHMQWFERVPYWLVADEATNKKVQLSDKEYQTLKKRMALLGMKLTAVKIFKREYFQAFIGSEVLEVGKAPLPDDFSWKCITGEPDKNKGTWFGLVRIMRDPAKWSNKFFSQILHIINSNAKGGIMAEPDAFDDVRQAEESYARPEAITWMKKGALSGGAMGANPKWAKKPSLEFPAGLVQLLEFAVSSIRDVTGINLELLGLRDINQPGVLEALRKQAGMTVLATMFDSLRRFRKRVGKARLFFIQNFLSDGRLIRIAGPDGAKVIPLLRDQCVGEYDVVVDDAPTSPNQKEATWAAIAPLLPMFKDQLTTQPELLIAILEYGPFPQRLLELMRSLFARAAQDPTAQQQKQLLIAKLVASIAKDQSTAELQNAKAGATQATAMYDVAMARNLLLKHGLDGAADHLDQLHKIAQINKDQAATEHIRAQTRDTHADATRTGFQTLLDAAAPMQPGQMAA